MSRITSAIKCVIRNCSCKRRKKCRPEDLPPVLFRTICKKDLCNHLEGRLWFHSPAYYRTIENPRRQDGLEGVGSWREGGMMYNDISDPKRGRHLNPAYILCFSEARAAPRMRSAQPRSDTQVVQLTNPEELRKRIQQRVLSDCCVIDVEWHKVLYDKTMDVSDTPEPQENRGRKYWHKPKEFAEEKEWRLIIFFQRNSMPIANDRLELHLGPCRDLFRPLP